MYTSHKEGKQEGLVEGETKKALKVAEKAILEGLYNQIISRITGLSMEEIEKIRKEIKNG